MGSWPVILWAGVREKERREGKRTGKLVAWQPSHPSPPTQAQAVSGAGLCLPLQLHPLGAVCVDPQLRTLESCACTDRTGPPQRWHPLCGGCANPAETTPQSAPHLRTEAADAPRCDAGTRPGGARGQEAPQCWCLAYGVRGVSWLHTLLKSLRMPRPKQWSRCKEQQPSGCDPNGPWIPQTGA